jgi:hypothetical protein
LLAHLPGVTPYAFAIPGQAWCRRRWLGIDPPGALELPLDAPLWRALAGEDDRDRRNALAAARPLAERLDAYGDCMLGAYRLDGQPTDWVQPDEIDDSGRAWAPAFADRLVSLFADDAPRGERNHRNEPDYYLLHTLFLALVRAGVTIEPRWDRFLPFAGNEHLAYTHECVRAIPEERRAAAIAAQIAGSFPCYMVPLGLEMLRAYPSLELARAVLGRADDGVGDLMTKARRRVAEDVRACAGHVDGVGAAVDAYLAALPMLPALRRAATWRVDDPALPERVQSLVEMTSDAWAGQWGPGTEYTRVHELVDGTGAPAYDVVSIMDEDASIYSAADGTEVGAMVQYGIQVPDPALAEALQMALADRPRG